MDDYLSEKEQIDKIRKWWKENGTFVIAGLVLGIGGIAGWNYWHAYKLQQAEEAGAVYAAIATNVDSRNFTQADAELDTLESDYGASPYLDQARLLIARVRVEQGDLAGAAVLLKKIVDDSSDPELALIARVRLARVLIADGVADEALQVLSLKDAGIFTPKFHELRGDIFAGRGEVEAAREEYLLAMTDSTGGVIDTQVIQFKLDALGAPVMGDSQEDS